jgi:hypothetical protein
MVTQERSSPIRRVARVSLSVDERPVATDGTGRLLQLALALYLLPALLAVLAVGSLGMLVLAVSGCSQLPAVHRSAKQEDH